MSIGTLCMSLGLILSRFPRLAETLGPNWTHALRGLLLGLSISFNLYSVRLGARRRSCAKA
jgi:hypothetical protein